MEGGPNGGGLFEGRTICSYPFFLKQKNDYKDKFSMTDHN